VNEDLTRWENKVRQQAALFTYPDTPDLTKNFPYKKPQVTFRRLVTTGSVVLLLIIVFMAFVPAARAAVLRALQVGGITILFQDPYETTTLRPFATETQSVVSPVNPQTGEKDFPGKRNETPTITPVYPSRDHIGNLQDEVTLEEAREFLGLFGLPKYPPALGLPDHIFLPRGYSSGVAVLVWEDGDDAGKNRIVLHILNDTVLGIKTGVDGVETTSVNGVEALWVNGDYFLTLVDTSGAYTPYWQVSGQVLIWYQDGYTYRLETGLTLEETLQIAESIETE
jgi:hypothetical protein